MASTDKMVQYKKEESLKKEQLVIDTINKMVNDKKEITFTTVYKEAGVSKGFVYQNQNIRSLIEHYMEHPVHSKKTQDSKDVIIDMQKQKIKELEKENKSLKKQLENDNAFEIKYKKLLEENKQLKKQLETAYNY